MAANVPPLRPTMKQSKLTDMRTSQVLLGSEGRAKAVLRPSSLEPVLSQASQSDWLQETHLDHDHDHDSLPSDGGKHDSQQSTKSWADIATQD